jgi:SAM-dependent methyltransferase
MPDGSAAKEVERTDLQHMATDSEQMLGRYSRRRSRLYRLLHPPLLWSTIPPSARFPILRASNSLSAEPGGGIPAGFINIDAVFYPGVDVIADVQSLPFHDNSVAAIECDAVLEHVPNPTKAVSELLRVLRPGGFLHVVVPFCHPFHGYPSDYHRWTTKGLEQPFLAEHWEMSEIGVRTGPTATLLTTICEYSKLIGGKAAYALAGWILWPLRYVDLWLNRRPNAYVLANHLYVLVRKRGHDT